MKPILLFIFICLMLGSPLLAEEVAKVRIYQDGKITWNAKQLELDKADTYLKTLKEANGVVWYYRENPQSEPHPNAMTFLEKVMKNGLPISFSTEEDFSTVVLPDGTIKPR